MGDKLSDILASLGWATSHTQQVPGRSERVFDPDDLHLGMAASRLLAAGKVKLYGHQKEAIRLAGEGKNVVLTTATASGKTLAFQIAALEYLQSDAAATVLAFYPVRALVSEQEARWRETLKNSGLGEPVRRIDGGVLPVASRLKLLAEARVIVATPDVVHAWLLSNLGQRQVRAFLKHLKLIVIDEAHTYTGVFGSNAAYLFRRIQHAVNALGGETRFIAASATMVAPDSHLLKMTGGPFAVVSEDANTAPRQPAEVRLLIPPAAKDILSSCATLLRHIARDTDHNVIAFVDSRKQTEHIAAIARREEDANTPEHDGEENALVDEVRQAQIWPYRSGYEELDRQQIQQQLSNGTLKGVVSTSALELGIDIPHLDVAILLGVPRSATSLYQRIGRVGRKRPGTILVINDGSVVSEAVFRAPESLMSLPLVEGALYLENRRIQYIHALCLARRGGEDDAVTGARSSEDSFETRVSWPESFVRLCQSERVGEIDQELQSMKSEAGDDPQHAYPLRDVEATFQVEQRRGPELTRLGSLSYSQVLREAYPGAVYYYKASAYRITRVNTHTRKIDARKEKQFTTKPIALPPLIYPNLTQGNVDRACRFDELCVVDCGLQISNLVTGYKERRGPNEAVVPYPLDPELGCFFDRPAFSRNFFSTGVILAHPKFSDGTVQATTLAEIVYEAFMLIVGYERQDVGFGVDKFRVDREPFEKGARFLALFDQTYGSLRLASRVMDTDLLGETLERASELCAADERFSSELGDRGASLLSELARTTGDEAEALDVSGSTVPSEKSTCPLVIKPGSRGIDLMNGNQEFTVERVFFSPRLQALAYRGFHDSEERRRLGWGQNGDAASVVSVAQVVAIPDVSELGYFDADTGEFVG
jgi:DEAD/DEAH box helicase domain-containing protein